MTRSSSSARPTVGVRRPRSVRTSSLSRRPRMTPSPMSKSSPRSDAVTSSTRTPGTARLRSSAAARFTASPMGTAPSSARPVASAIACAPVARFNASAHEAARLASSVARPCPSTSTATDPPIIDFDARAERLNDAPRLRDGLAPAFRADRGVVDVRRAEQDDARETLLARRDRARERHGRHRARRRRAGERSLVHERVRVRRTRGRILREHPRHEIVERRRARRSARASAAARARGAIFASTATMSSPTNGGLPREALEEHAAEREHVGARVEHRARRAPAPAPCTPACRR